MSEIQFVMAACPVCGDCGYHDVAEAELGVWCLSCDTPLVQLLDPAHVKIAEEATEFANKTRRS
jgi:ribosomal protein L37AE/L43A